jgi:hypothetical protein
MTKAPYAASQAIDLTFNFEEKSVVRSRIPASRARALNVIKATGVAVCFLLSLLMMTGCSSTVTGNAAANGESKTENSSITSGRDAESLPSDLLKVPTVTYCDLIRSPATYDHRIVRLRAVYFNGFERMFLYDQNCIGGEPPQAPKNIPAEMWVEWDEAYRKKDSSAEATKYRETKPEERKDVTLIGRFYATREINNTGSGRYQFRIMRVEKVLDIHPGSENSR